MNLSGKKSNKLISTCTRQLSWNPKSYVNIFFYVLIIQVYIALNSILRMMLHIHIVFTYFTTQHRFTFTNSRNATGRSRYSGINFSNLSHCTISSIMSTDKKRNNSCYSSLFFKSYEWRCICVCCSKAPVASVALLQINILFEYKDWST